RLLKQAACMMLWYVFSAEELGALLTRLGYPCASVTIPRNVADYDCRSSHGSTLSRLVHAWVLARADRPRAMRYFAEALQSDVSDIQQAPQRRASISARWREPSISCSAYPRELK